MHFRVYLDLIEHALVRFSRVMASRSLDGTTFLFAAAWSVWFGVARRNSAGLRPRLRLLRRQRNELPSAPPFFLLEGLTNGVEVVAVLCGVAFTHTSHFFDDRIFPHRSLSHKLFWCADDRDAVPMIVGHGGHHVTNLSIRDVLAVPCKQVVHAVNRRQRDMERVLGSLLR